MNSQSFYTSKLVETDFETTIEKLKSALAEEGFGIVSEINMQEKLKAGAGKEIDKYMILGACNPQGAYQAVQIEQHIGVMLPCNFIVRETDNGQVEVSAVNPQQTIASIGKAEMKPLADEIGSGMQKAMNNI
ncbi:MAG: DUF302 domain-containing protein [Bacteroidetes bacterium]|nr:DUF302 domain-containing protein [Bacteroidota bacterium]